jgi:hypothetical protein
MALNFLILTAISSYSTTAPHMSTFMGPAIVSRTRNVTRYLFEASPVYKISLLHVVQRGSGVHPTSYTMGTGGSFPGVKRPGREADHSPPTSAEVRKMGFYTSTPRRRDSVVDIGNGYGLDD